PEWSKPLNWSAFTLAAITVVVHTGALIARMYMMERPFVFVTNLYGTAIFIGWISVLLGLAFEAFNRNGVGSFVIGVAGFATMISFTGTVLGGIWADQSWGRFWGWDPKENGALLIVVWNALILHARWGGLVKQRGMAVLALFGNIITIWSWWGVNMLGVGL